MTTSHLMAASLSQQGLVGNIVEVVCQLWQHLKM